MFFLNREDAKTRTFFYCHPERREPSGERSRRICPINGGLDPSTNARDDSFFKSLGVLVSWWLLFMAFVTPAHAADKFLDIQEIKTESGVTAWLVEDHSLPVVALQFAFKGAGAINDPAEEQGLTRLLSNTMDEGAGDYNAQAFQKALTDHSISLYFGASRDHFTGTLKTLTRHEDLAFELLQNALSKPHFADEAVERMKAANMARIRSSLSDPEWIAARLLNDVAFADEPYALNSGGTLSTLPTITPDMLRAAVKARLAKDNLAVSVVGDITADELKTRLDQLFGALPDKAQLFAGEAYTVEHGGETVLFKKDIPQTIIRIMQPGVGRTDADYYPALLMDFILGGSGFGSRLTEEIREKRGLTYGVQTGFYELDHLKAYTIATSTKSEKAGEMLPLIKAEMIKMQDAPVTAAELKAAQSYLIGSMPLALSSTDKIAGLMLGLMLDELPVDWLDQRAENIAAVTPADIQTAAQTILRPDELTVIMVGTPLDVTPTRTVETLPNVE